MPVPSPKVPKLHLTPFLRLIPFSLIFILGITLYIDLYPWTLLFGVLSGILISPFVLAYLRRPQPRRISPFVFGGLAIGLHIPLLRTTLYPLTDWKAWLFFLAQSSFFLGVLYTTLVLVLLVHRRITRARAGEPSLRQE